MTKIHIVADLYDTHKHVFEISSDGDFLDRELNFTVFDPKTAGAARIVASDSVDALSSARGSDDRASAS